MKQNIKNRNLLIIAIVLHICMVALEIIGLVQGIYVFGWKLSVGFYTQQSNAFTMIMSGIYAVYAFLALKKGRAIPKTVSLLRYMATCCMTLTFVVTAGVLVPAYGLKQMMFGDCVLYCHLICPLLSMLLLLFIEPVGIDAKDRWKPIIPTVCYALIIIPINVFNIIESPYPPYPFLRVHEQTIFESVMWGIGIIAINLLFAWLLWMGVNLRKRTTASDSDRITQTTGLSD